MAVDRGVIDTQLREIGAGDRWWEQREFRELPYILQPGERIQGLVVGRVLASRRPRLTPARRWLIVATDQRLLCLRQERFSRRQIEFGAGQILRLVHGSRIRSYQISVETPGRRVRIRVPKVEAARFVAALAPLLPQTHLAPLDPHVEQFSWIPGLRTVAALPGVTRIVSSVAMLSPPDPVPREQIERLETAIAEMRGEIEELRQSVEFLEDLLQTQGEISRVRALADPDPQALSSKP
jgi:hypothetical protein